MKRLIFIGCIGLGCAEQSNSHLSRLTRAWAVETADAASPAVTGTIVLSALASSLCVQQDDPEFLALEVGDNLPLSPMLSQALGNPELAEFSSNATLKLTLLGVDVLDRTEQWLRITGLVDGNHYSIDIDALIDDGSAEVEPARLTAFGQLRLELDGACSTQQSLVRGKALWIDTLDRRHDVNIPADSDLGGDLAMSGEIPYLPSSGALGWSTRIDGQERSVTTEDAGEIRVDTPDDEVPAARWPVVARGPGWSGTAFTDLAP